MKSIKIILLCITLLLGFNLYSQNSPIDQGSYMINGGLSYTSMGGKLYETDDDRINNIQMTSNVGTFVFDNVLLGGKLLYTHMKQGKGNMSSFGIGPSYAYFFDLSGSSNNVKGNLYPYLGTSFMYVIYGSKTYYYLEDKTEKSSTSGFLYSFSGGINYMITRSCGLATEIGYQITTIEGISGNQFNLVIGFVVFIN